MKSNIKLVGGMGRRARDSSKAAEYGIALASLLVGILYAVSDIEQSSPFLLNNQRSSPASRDLCI